MKNFHISKFELPRHIIASIKGFDEEVYASLMTLGMQTPNGHIMDMEFVSNLGTLLIWITSNMSEGKATDVDWRFSQHGVLYMNTEESFDVVDREDNRYHLNPYEFGFAVGLSACQENMMWAINNGFKNPFKISYFYFNFLKECVMHMEPSLIRENVIFNIVQSNEPENFGKFKGKLESLLDIPVTP
jgi:hypothetical protein